MLRIQSVGWVQIFTFSNVHIFQIFRFFELFYSVLAVVTATGWWTGTGVTKGAGWAATAAGGGKGSEGIWQEQAEGNL